jgi:hypothetical protein
MTDDLRRRRLALKQQQLRLQGAAQGGETEQQQRWAAAKAGTLPQPTGTAAERQAAIDAAAMQDVQRAGQEKVVADSPVASRLAVAAQGLPFVGEYVDEAAGALMGDGAQERIRSMQTAMEETRPGETAALRIGGGVLGSGALVGPAAGFIGRGANTLMQVVRGGVAGAALGGAEGAVSGYGAGNDGDRMQSAAERGLLGTAMGGVIGAAAPAVAKGVSSVLQRFRKSDIQTIAREFDISPDAARVVRRALDAEDFTSAQQAIDRAGGRAMLADAGDATRSLLDASIASGGAATRTGQAAVQSRAQAGGQEFTRVMDRFFGKPQGIKTAQAGIRAGSQGARSAAYDAAYAAPIDYSARAGIRLQSLTPRIPSSAIQRANRLMQLEGQQSKQIMASIADDGTVTFQRLPDVRQWDYITRALGDLAESGEARGAMGGMSAESRALTGLQRQIRDTLRSHVPAYNKALREAADTIGQVKATEVGASLLRQNTTREQAVAAVRGMTAAERAAARQGLRSQIDDMMARTTRALTDDNMDAREAIAAWRALSSRQSQQNIEALMGKGRAQALAREVDRIATDFELRAAVSANSKTAIRQSIQGEVREVTNPGILDTLMQGEPVNATKAIVRAMTGRTPEAVAARQAGLYQEIVETLTRTRGAAEARRIMGEVGQSMALQPISQARADRIAGSLAAGLAAGGYQAGTQTLGR